MLYIFKNLPYLLLCLTYIGSAPLAVQRNISCYVTHTNSFFHSFILAINISFIHTVFDNILFALLFSKMVMLKNIPRILSPELLSVLARMGHGDQIILADANFPSASIAKAGPELVS